jgi:cytochrome c553
MVEHTEKQDSRLSAFTLFVVLLNAVLVIFLAQMTVGVRQQVATVQGKLLQIEELSRRVAPVRSPGDYLAEQCASCHSERRYLGEHGTGNIQQLIDRMNALPDAHIGVGERNKIHGALLMMKCQRCHGDEVFSRLATLNKQERRTTVLRMWEHAETKLSRQEVMEILKAFEQIQGF